MSGLHDKQYMEILEEDMGKLRIIQVNGQN